MVHSGVVDGVRRISNSEIQSFKSCRRQWWLAWYRGLRFNYEVPIEKKHNGDRIHRALQPWYVPEGVPRVDPREALEDAIREDRGAYNEYLNASGRGDSAEDTDEWVKLVKLNDLERIMIEGYMEWVEAEHVDENLEIVASETYLEVPIPGFALDVRAVGKIDVRARFISNGQRVFIDHKTADVAPKLDDLERNEQMQYYELLEYLTPGEEACTGALYNVLRRVKRTARAKPPFYERHLITHNRHRRNAFYRRTIATVREMLAVEAALDDGVDPLDIIHMRPSRDCGWQCSFAAICTMFDDGSRVEDLLAHHYVVGDPLHYYGDIIDKTRNGEA